MDRLNKYLAHAGVGSRRHCEELIVRGRVTVNGHAVRELGTKVEPDAAVCVDGQPLHGEKLVYWLVNKPRGYLCTNHDPAGRPLAVDLVPHVPQRVYTVGRLDEDSEGLLLSDQRRRPGQPPHAPALRRREDVSRAGGRPSRPRRQQQLLKGVWLSDGHVRARRVKRLKAQGDSTWLEVVLNEGKNREIRRMLARLGHKVMVLRRTAIGSVRLDRLPRGKARRLKVEELDRLRRRLRSEAESRQPTAESRDMTPIVHAPAQVRENVVLARQTYRIRLHMSGTGPRHSSRTIPHAPSARPQRSAARPALRPV